MRVTSHQPYAVAPYAPERTSRQREQGLAETGSSRAMITIAPASSVGHDPSPSYRPAPFLAHLIATREQFPQTRERRRLEPADAVRAYQTALSETTARTGQRLSITI